MIFAIYRRLDIAQAQFRNKEPSLAAVVVATSHKQAADRYCLEALGASARFTCQQKKLKGMQRPVAKWWCSGWEISTGCHATQQEQDAAPLKILD